jgi:hypothetical protein
MDCRDMNLAKNDIRRIRTAQIASRDGQSKRAVNGDI